MEKFFRPDGYFNHVIKMKRVGTLEMAEWCDNNCSDNFSGSDRSSLWLFDTEEDAIAFKLRWI